MKCGVSRTITKRLEAKDNPKKVLKLEEDQGYAKRVKFKDGLEREESSYKRRPRKAPGPRKWSTGNCRLYSQRRKS